MDCTIKVMDSHTLQCKWRNAGGFIHGCPNSQAVGSGHLAPYLQRPVSQGERV